MTGSKILIVEDEAVSALDLQYRLSGLGYIVDDIVATGEDAVKKAVEFRPDLVLMDIMLSGEIDGVTAAEQIKSLFDIPVIYITAFADETTIQRAKITEPYGYIIKPFQERELDIAIDMALYKHKMEKMLKESERWFATTLKSIGDAVIATDIDGVITFMNPVAEDLTGWKMEEASSRNLTDIFRIINMETRLPVENPVLKVLLKGMTVGLANHTVLIARNGTEVPIDDSAAPIKDDKGNMIGAILVFRDITEREKAEKELRKAHEELEARVQERTKELREINAELETEIRERKRAEMAVIYERQRFFDVLEMLPTYVVLLTPDYHVSFANRVFREQFGESGGRRCFELLFNRTEPCEICETYKVLSTNAAGRWEWTGPDARTYDIFDFPFVDSDGSNLILEMGIDISERKQAEDNLRRAHDKLEILVQERTAELREEIEQRKRAEEGLQIAKDILENKVRERTALLTETNESLLAEIEERKRTEKKLLSTQKDLRAMISEIVHTEERSRQHFATDLHDSVVQTLAAAKLRSQLIQDQISKKLQPIFIELQNLISESIIQARSIMTELSPPILSEFGLMPALEWLTEQIGSKNRLDIKFENRSEAVSLPHEIEVLLFQATRELLMNVVKHAKAESATVKFSSNGQKLSIEVTDNGKGFDKKKTFKPDMKGGFGLYGIRERLRHIGGQLSIKSIADQGTTVLILAPRNVVVGSRDES
jgi:PAS domain S-box-containing protein